MPDQLQLRGGTTTEHNTFTGASKEVTIDTTKKTAVVHDGSTAGGNPLLREDGSNSALALGSQGTPSLKFTGDTNTGIYSPGADQVAISTGGTGRLFVDASGNVTVDTNTFYVDAVNNRVGVGTTSPDELLHLSSTNNASLLVKNTTSSGPASPQLQLQNDDGHNFSIEVARSGQGGFTTIDFNAANTASNNLRFANDTGEVMRLDGDGRLLVGTSTSPSAGNGQYANLVVQGYPGVPTGDAIISLQRGQTAAEASANNPLGNVSFGYEDGTTAASIIARQDGAGGASDYPGRLEFLTTADGASAPTTRMTIKENGRVGIGVTSPAELLHVNNPSTTANVRISGGSTAATYSNLSFYGGTTKNAEIYANSSFFGLTASNSNPIRFDTGGSESARIDSSGRLLVGTSTNLFGSIVQSASTGGAQYEAARFSANAFGPTISLIKSRGASVGTNAAVQDDDILGQIAFRGANGTDYSNVGAHIQALVDGEPFSSGDTTDLPGRLVFATTANGAPSPTERMSIRNDGGVFISTTTGTINSSNFGTRIGGTGTTAGNFRTSRNVGVGGEVAAFYGQGGQLIVKGDGDCENTNNSYTGISDVKLKENIVDASSQWDDLKALQVRNYNFKVETGYSTHTQIGLVAQEVELVSPGLVGESIDEETGESTKSVKYSILYMKAVKALQEAMERIETLEAKVAALEAN